jgi:Fic-DOC domain mobile mystery protein B
MHHLAGDGDGRTPLDDDEVAGLLRSAVTTRSDLDVVEQENIVAATVWAFARRRSVESILDEPFVRLVHRRMFGDVWRWAGSYRVTERNIGVDAWAIRDEIGRLLGDVRYWVEHESHGVDEICVRLHHRFAYIHPFPNGNGRHARLMADILAVALDRPRFTWGRNHPGEPAELRARYLAALRLADDGDVDELVAFART